MERHNIEFHSPIEIKFIQGKESTLIRKKDQTDNADNAEEELANKVLLLKKQAEEDDFYRKLIGANFSAIF